ncbi:MAG: SDR family NAD(P)-dependent oxidoreductase [Deltaproteobacteria bacterium]|nr:SDR family NAD(P)-dependent oxidoreductase [Deltaproteobacteria bacterium]
MKTLKGEKRTPIAICGIGCHFPGEADTPERFWNMLKDGTDAIGPVPRDRWNSDLLYDPNHKTRGKIHIKEGGFISRVDEFDASFFGISPHEAHSMDPSHRLLLEHTFMAFEDAGEPLNRIEGERVGVFVGTSSSEYGGIMQNFTERASINSHTNAGSSPAITANRISYVFDFHGPSFAVDTACSASLLAAHLACRSIWNGESSAAVVAGVNLMLKPELHIGFSTAGFLSPDARSKSFDASANGYVRSEGVGVLYLKPLDQAIADGNRIYATIIGSATNEDGRTNGIALPNPDAQIDVITMAYADAGIKPEMVTLVEAHGTGTAAGDPIECNSIGAVIGKDRNDTCLIGSVKSNIGHTELASGSAGLIKLALSLYHREAPPVVHFKTPNPKVDFNRLKIQVVDRHMPIPSRNGIIYAGINSFGFGGANVHLVMQSYSTPHTGTTVTHESFPLPLLLSARNDSALQQLAGAYKRILEADNVSLPELSKQAATRRSQLEIRAAVAATDRSDAIAKLSDMEKGISHPHVIKERPTLRQADKIAFVFSGQGPQWYAMGRELLKTDETFRDTIEEVNGHLKSLGWLERDNSSLLEELQLDEAESRIDKTEIVQPAIFALQVGLARIWKRLGVEPAMVTGHSIGEVAAAYVSGAISMADAVKVVFWRSRCQANAAGRGRMMAAGLTVNDAQPYLSRFDGKIDIAAVNGAAMLTLAGESEALEVLSQMLKDDKIFCRFLVVDVPFHSYLLDDVAEQFKSRAPQFKGADTQIPYYSTVFGCATAGAKINREYWARNIRDTVQFYPTIEKMIDDGATVFVEIGPHPILSHGIREALDAKRVSGVIVPSLRRKDSEKLTMTRSLAALHVNGVSLDWKYIFSRVADKNIQLPLYPWQREKFWIESNVAREARLSNHIHHHLRRKTVAADNTTDIIWEVELDARTAPYILDHRVQGPVVYPGAGHVDLAVAAGMASFNDAFGFIEDMEFMSPLFLKEDGAPNEVQIHIDTDDGQFTIASRDSQNHSSEWTLHSKGKLNYIGDRFDSTPVTLAVLKSRIEEPVELAPLFETLSNGGLDLGDTFRGIEALKRRDNEALGKIRIHPSIKPFMNQFKLHPALLDASFQSAFGIIEDHHNMGVYIPKKIGRIKFYTQPDGDFIYSYASAKKHEAEFILVDIWVFSENGTLVAEIQNFMGQYLKGSRGEVDGEIDNLFFSPHLRRSFRPSQLLNRHSEKTLTPLTDVRQAALAEIARVQSDAVFSPFFDELGPAMDDLAIGYIVRAFEKMGAPIVPGRRYDIEGLPTKLKIAQRHIRLFKYILQQLEERKIFIADGTTYTVASKITLPQPEAILRRATADLKPFSSELNFFKPVGESIAEVLTGSLDPTEVLFAESKWNDTIEYYSSAYSMNKYNRIAAAAIESLVRDAGNRSIRIIEIGGGTGGVTQAILPLLSQKNASYVFTDISPAFMEQAQKRFADFDFISYKTLNIEDPVEAQGQSEHSYDLVIAANALHATKNIQDTLKNVHGLLANNGVLCLLEATTVPFYVNIAFGMTEGWWRYNDDVRMSHCTMKRNDWINVLEQTGFADAVAMTDVEDGDFPQQSVVIARAAVQRPKIEPSPMPAKWIIFGDSKGTATQLISRIKNRGDEWTLVTSGSIAKSDAKRELFHLPGDLSSIRHLFDGIKETRVEIVFARPIDIGDIEDTEHFLTIRNEVLVEMTALSRILIEKGLRNVTLSIITEGVHNAMPNITQSAIWGIGRVMFNELSDNRIRLIDIATTDLQHIEQLWDELENGDSIDEEVILGSGQRFSIRLEPLSPQKRRSNSLKRENITGLGIRLNPNENGIIQQVYFAPYDGAPLSRDEVIIEVHHAGLNFRDVMVAGGALPKDAIDGGIFGNGLGLECAGIVLDTGSHVSHVKAGDRVMAISANAISGRAVAKSSFVRRIPQNVTMEMAASIPMAALTAYTALVHLGNIQPGSRVLIHAGAGGVGMYAIHFALSAGATVFATASPEKHGLLREIGVHYIYNSRSTAYYSEIMADTKGAGINVVLNSLSGSHITQSLKLLSPMGRFIEIGKKDLYADKRIGMRLLADNISYHALDIDRLLSQAPQLISTLFSDAVDFLEKNGWPNIPVVHMPFENVANALTQMAAGNHVGKIILDSGIVSVHPKDSLILRDDATYLIAGGTRGLGLATAEFLTQKGARHIALFSRSGLHGQEEIDRVKAMQANGIQVETFAVDICDQDAVNDLVHKVHNIGRPLAGIVQSTLVLEDALLHQMTPDQMVAPLRPKIEGTWNLHRATQNISLDFFISFSSVSSLYGLPGQGNYAAANRFLDDFCRYRRALGLTASTINLGPLGETGFVSREEKIHDYLDQSGWLPLSNSEVFRALERVILEGHTQTGVFRLDWAKLNNAFPALAASPRYQAVRKQLAIQADKGDASNIKQQLTSASEKERRTLIHQILKEAMEKILGIDRNKLDFKTPINRMGMDSLMSNQLRSVLTQQTGVEFSLMQIMQGPTLTDLATEIEHGLKPVTTDKNTKKTPKTVWSRPIIRRRKASVRLFTLPYLGAGASIFSDWRLSPEIEVCPIQLPGREERSNEPPISVGENLISEMAAGIAPLLDKPFALYGHSYGGNLAMSLASYLDGNLGKRAEHVFIGAAIPPGVENPLENEFRLTDTEDALKLSENRMRALLERIGTPRELLEDAPRFATMLPALRADLGITRQRLFTKDHVLKSPITAIAGTSDHLYSEELIAHWQTFTTQFALHTVEGGHLFLHEPVAKSQVLQHINETLAPSFAANSGLPRKTA